MSKIVLTEEGAKPSTPAAGKWDFYFKADGLYYLDDAGTEVGPITDVLASNNTFTATQTITPTSGQFGLLISGTIDSASSTGLAITTSITGTVTSKGLYVVPTLSVVSGSVYGALISPTFTALTALGTQPSILSVQSNPIISAGATANVTTIYGFLSRVDNASTGGSVISSVFNYFVSEGTTTGARTNQYGLYVSNLTNATTINRAIQTGTGYVVFGDNVNIGTTNVDNTTSMLKVTQTSTTATQPVLELDQSDASEEMINFIVDATTSGYPVDTATAVGTAYARLRVAVNGTFKYIQLYNA